MFNDPSKIPQTSYVRFAQASDPQLQSINARATARGNLSTQAAIARLEPMPHKTNPVQFYDRNVPYAGDTTYIRFQPAGETLNIVDRPATENDKLTFNREYQAYLANKSQRPDGTPLEVIGVHPQHIKQLEAHNIFIVEQVASLSDTADQVLYSVGLGPELKRRAIHYLNYAKAQKALDEKDEIIAELKQELAQLKQKKRPRID